MIDDDEYQYADERFNTPVYVDPSAHIPASTKLAWCLEMEKRNGSGMEQLYQVPRELFGFFPPDEIPARTSTVQAKKDFLRRVDAEIRSRGLPPRQRAQAYVSPDPTKRW